MDYLLFEIVANELVKVSVQPVSVSDIYEKLEQPPNPELGDVAFPCFSLAKVLKKAPRVIAEDMRAQMVSQAIFNDVKVSGGYLNFYLDRDRVLKLFFDKVKSGLPVDFSDYLGKKVTIEHTSVNPSASPHIGNARNAMIGDACVKLFKFLGCDVNVRYFVNDIGKQIALLVYCTRGISEINFSELLNLYVDANEKISHNPELEQEVFVLLKRMENGDEEIFAEFARIVDICIKGQMEIFNEFGIYYDQYDYESQYVQSGKIEEILDALKDTGRLFEDEVERLVLNLEEFKLNSEHPYLPLTRKNKTSLYPLRDICYNIDKAKDSPDRNIVILGEDQRLYGRQINAALSLLGIKGTEIVNYSFVLLSEGKMSKRGGQVVLLEDLMYETVKSAKAAILEHRSADNLEELLADDILPKQLAYGAIKYSVLKCSNEKNVVFDREAALNFQGDTSVYIQYSFARIQSLLRGKSLDVHGGLDAGEGVNINGGIWADESLSVSRDDIIQLTHPIEWEIVKKILSFNQVLGVVSRDFNFSALCSYLFELCQYFSRWYRECPIKNAPENLKPSRLFLAFVIGEIIKNGLGILGIDAPEKI